jgi:heme iron utilization protein
METDKISDEIRALLDAERGGMLSTISKKVAGWPFGSITPYAISHEGAPILLLSEIAEHTKNVRADARASLLVRDSKALDDPQAGARATLVGYVIPVPAPFLDSTREKYLELFPNSAGYFEVHDFTLFQIKVSQVRYIGGFGEIHWVDGGRVFGRISEDAIDPLARYAPGICDHMNQDHSDALLLFAAKLGSIEAESAEMIDADSQGFDMIAIRGGNHRHLRINFPEKATTPEEARRVMVNLVRQVKSS